MVFVPYKAQIKQLVAKVANFVVWLFLASIILFFSAGVYITQQANYWVGELGREIQREFGFNHGSPYLKVNGKRIEVFTIHPTPGGLLEKAGFRESDIILDYDITGFYKTLYKSRGKVVEVHVVDFGDGDPIRDRPARVIRLRIPSAHS